MTGSKLMTDNSRQMQDDGAAGKHAAVSSQDDLITVIVPVYNVEDYLEGCLSSILGQTYRNTQIIIVNDGSTDESTRICREFAAKDSRILLIEQENGGLSCARNTGLDHASGSYVNFVDSDDSLEPEFLEKLHGAVLEWDADFVACGYYVTDETGAITFESKLDEGLLDEFLFWKTAADLYKLNFYVWNKLYRRDFIEGARFPLGKRCQDVAYQLEVVPNAKRIYFISEPLYRYRIRSSSISNLPSAQTNLDPIEFDIANMEYYEKKGYTCYIPHMLHCTIAHLARIQPKPGDSAEEERYRGYLETIDRFYRAEVKRGSLSPSIRARYRLLKVLGNKWYMRLSNGLRKVKPS